MAFEKHNNLWEFRKKHGRNYKYTPETLWNEAIAYFQWCEEHPLMEVKVFSYMGVTTKEKLPKMRAMTINGFCLYADVTDQTLINYEKKGGDFLEVIRAIKKAIYEQKLTGAAADLLNANIISRELGLIDKIQTESSNNINITVSSEKDKQEIEKLKDKFENE